MFHTDLAETRPDTRPPVADGWAGAEMRVLTFRLDGYGRTDGRSDGRTDKASYRVACPQPKMGKNDFFCKTRPYTGLPKAVAGAQG